MGTSSPVRLTTATLWTEGESSRALSAFCFKGLTLPPRGAPSAVTRTLASASFKRPRKAAAEKALKTTECGATILAQASMAIANSGIVGR